MSIGTAGMIIFAPITPEQRQAIDDHWSAVRAGLHRPEQHDYAPFTRQDAETVAYRGIELLRQADHMMRQIKACDGGFA